MQKQHRSLFSSPNVQNLVVICRSLCLFLVCCVLLGLETTGYSAPQSSMTLDPPLNHLQFIGTHNSYHIAPPAKLRRLIEAAVPGQGEVLDYTHPPLAQQLDTGIRQIELDLYNDPHGGLYTDPLGLRLVGESVPDTQGAMKTPGFKVLHSPDFDVLSTVPTLRGALAQLRTWSKAHPTHEPILVLLELKQESFSPRIQPPPFDGAALRALESEIRAEMPREQLLTPDDVRGTFATLREAVTERGWPHLSQTRGKFLFALDNEDATRDRYLALSPHQDLQERVCFVSVPPTHPAAAWMKRNDPQSQFDDICSLVKAGFMVRTRADADLKEVLTNDRARFDKAAASGAQWISTDAPEPNPRWPGYFVAWPHHATFRLSPMWSGSPNPSR